MTTGGHALKQRSGGGGGNKPQEQPFVVDDVERMVSPDLIFMPRVLNDHNGTPLTAQVFQPVMRPFPHSREQVQYQAIEGPMVFRGSGGKCLNFLHIPKTAG